LAINFIFSLVPPKFNHLLTDFPAISILQQPCDSLSNCLHSTMHKTHKGLLSMTL